jgi:hypothetical protein|tara:strand:- start:207 stop:410 length:204 start_codon:yes stop_codon:yes gene_type:complete
MDLEDRNKWENFLQSQNSNMTFPEKKLIAELHSKLFNHKYTIPCSCNPNKEQRQFRMWIEDINKLNK